MIVSTQESERLYREYIKVFGAIDKQSRKETAKEKRAMEIMLEMKRMAAQAKKIEATGRQDIIGNFNKKYLNLKMELTQLYGTA